MQVTSIKAGVVIISLFILVPYARAQREYGGIVTRERLQNTVKNCQENDAARAQRDAVTSAARPWVEKTDDALWAMVPGQALPRTIDVTWDYDHPDNPKLGCLKCGDKIEAFGGYPYEPDFEKKPWKLTCPSCGVVFPTNDFGKYYASGIDERGLFNPTKADKKLLFNTEHPDPADPLHKYGVDDGYSYVDANGREHKFIGYYAWKYWRHIITGAQTLADAYLYTGDKLYARKAAILLDRIADVYPEMDWKPYADKGWYHSDGSGRTGKIEGRIWETGQISAIARSYDKIISGTLDNPELYSFLAAKAKQFKLPGNKGSREDLLNNVDTGFLEVAAKALISRQVFGNEGMHQASMCYVALALNSEPKTSQWLDWVFDPNGGKLPTMAVNLFDRDGMANEAAPGYCYLWPGKLMEIMNILEPYTAYTKNRLTRDYPTLENTFRAPWRVQLLNTFMPNIGDTGAVGTLATGVNPALLASGYKFFNDPVLAHNAWEANGGSAKGLLVDIGLPTPDALNQALEKAARAHTPRPRHGEHMPAYGLVHFDFGNNKDGKGLWFYYGRTDGHGHQDRLNYSIYAFNTDLTPDLGYPEFANSLWPRRKAWNNNTISHNTVVVDKSIQKDTWTGYPRFYTAQPGFGAAEVSSPNAYPQTSEYARTLAFVETPDRNAYSVDIFRVSGGKDHVMSFHGPPGAVTPQGVSFAHQTTGTYAGETIAYGDNNKALPYGYSYLENVERAKNPPDYFSLDWKAEAGYRGVKDTDNLHLKLHVLGKLDDVALADGIPAPNKPGNPKALRYALMHRDGQGQKLESCFVSVAEPWKDRTFIKSVTRIAAKETTSAVGLKIELEGGAVDYVISNPGMKTVTIENGPATDGAFAWLRLINGQVTSASLTGGTSLVMGDARIASPGNVMGQLVKFEKDIRKPAVAWVKVAAGDPATMKGAQVYFDNDKVNTGCYDIVDATPEGDLWKITCGPGTFVRGFANEKDYAKGYVYNIREGADFVVPVTSTK